jgi:GntR family transcriptional regulator/MocR family aminotransferase
VGASAGLHVLAWLPPDIDEAALVASAGAAGVGLSGVTPRRIEPGGPGGIIFGYGAVTGSAIERGVQRLAALGPTAGR